MFEQPTQCNHFESTKSWKEGKSILVLLEVGSVSISTNLTDPTCQMVKMVSFPTKEKFWGPNTWRAVKRKW
jgi:hypothetical protein